MKKNKFFTGTIIAVFAVLLFQSQALGQNGRHTAGFAYFGINAGAIPHPSSLIGGAHFGVFLGEKTGLEISALIEESTVNPQMLYLHTEVFFLGGNLNDKIFVGVTGGGIVGYEPQGSLFDFGKINYGLSYGLKSKIYILNNLAADFKTGQRVIFTRENEFDFGASIGISYNF